MRHLPRKKARKVHGLKVGSSATWITWVTISLASVRTSATPKWSSFAALKSTGESTEVTSGLAVFSKSREEE